MVPSEAASRWLLTTTIAATSEPIGMEAASTASVTSPVMA